MTIQRMDNVLIVVDDLEAAKAFFAELGMELEGETPLEGRWVDRVVGLDDVRADIAMMRTPDGHSRVELTKFHTPPAVRAEPESGRLRGPYILAGTSALALIRVAMAEAGMRDDPAAILDLPCGHGRVIRVLRAAFPAATLIACDLDRDGVDFCAQTFECGAGVFRRRPCQRPDRGRRSILSGSARSSPTSTRRAGGGFLGLFARVLRPGGVLVVDPFDRPRLPYLGTMNLPDPAELLRRRDERGVAFQSYLHDDGYGIAVASADHVRRALSAGGEFDVMRHEPLSLFPALADTRCLDVQAD